MRLLPCHPPRAVRQVDRPPLRSPSPSRPCCSGGGAGGWTDFPPQRDTGGGSYSGHDRGGDRSSRGSEHSDKEGGGGSALAEALALRERERKRTMEERAALERSEKQRAASLEALRPDVSAVYDPPASAPQHAAAAPPAAAAHTPSKHSGRPYEPEAPPPAAYGHHAAAPAPPILSPTSPGRQAPPPSEYSAPPLSHSSDGAPPPMHHSASTGEPGGAYYSTPSYGGGGGAASAGGPPRGYGGGGGGDEGEGPLMAVAPLMLSPAATAAAAAAAYPAGLAPLDLSDMRRFLTTPTPRAAGIVQVGGDGRRRGLRGKRPSAALPPFSVLHCARPLRHLEPHVPRVLGLPQGRRPLPHGVQEALAEQDVELPRLARQARPQPRRPVLRGQGAAVRGRAGMSAARPPTPPPQVRSNFVGTEFVAFDDGVAPDAKPPPADRTHLRQEIAVVNYASNVLGSRGPRKMVR